VKHYSEEDLILHYYGERGRWRIGAGGRGSRIDIERHLDECTDCAAVYRSLAGTLRMLAAPEAPERGDQYGLEVWQRIRHRLPEQDAPWWLAWLRQDRLAIAGVVATLLVAAFGAGRWWSCGAPAPGSVTPAIATLVSRPGTPAAGDEARQRILLTSVAEHFDRSERILTDIMNAPEGGDISAEQRWAEDLVATSRLYRQDAVDAGEQSVAAVLDELERSLLEIVHTPSRATAANLDEIRRRIDAASLLFKVRVLGRELRERELPDRARTRTITSQTS
jgi:hypothetical protein